MGVEGFYNFCVKVSGGSGCLIQPATDEYSFVLTAAHVIENLAAEDIEVVRQTLGARGVVNNETIEVIEVFIHPDVGRDAAILKVPYQDGVSNLFRLYEEEFAADRDGFWLIGHPAERSANNYSYRQNPISIINRSALNYWEGEVAGYAGFDDVVGQSGGAILKAAGDFYLIAGIQSRMSAPDDNGTGRVDFMPVSFFDEIIAASGGQMAELYPIYLDSFEHLKTLAMKLVGSFPDLPFTRGYLQGLTRRVVERGLTPKTIKEAFRRRLLVFGQKDSALNNRGLWTAWLELLIILQVMQVLEAEGVELESLFNRTRLIFSETAEDWVDEISAIIRSDFNGLAEDGKIIVATNGAAAIPRIKSKNLVSNIGKIQLEEFQIDRPEHPLVKSDLVHLRAFQICVIRAAERYVDYDNASIEDLLRQLREDYESELR
jgi:hypothetical protein